MPLAGISSGVMGICLFSSGAGDSEVAAAAEAAVSLFSPDVSIVCYFDWGVISTSAAFVVAVTSACCSIIWTLTEVVAAPADAFSARGSYYYIV